MDDVSQALSSAVQCHQAGKLAEAERLYREILVRQPSNADALHLLGVVALQQARPAEAVELISRALDVAPNTALYLTHLGTAYVALQQWERAADSLRRALAANPQSAAAHFSLGVVQRSQGRFEQAAGSFQRAVAIDPARVEAHYNLGNTWNDLGRLDEAERCYREAIRRHPEFFMAINNLGNVLRAQGRLDAAVETLRQAVALQPDSALAHLNLGTALGDLGQFDDARACFSKALAIDPQFADGHDHLGTALQADGRFDEALACHETALQLDPQLADAHFNRATLWLRRGDFDIGWAEYECRWKCKNFTPFGGPQPRWDGSPLEGRTMMILTEQGLGDTLQYARYSQVLREMGGRVLLQCPAPLVRLLARCPAVDAVVPSDAPLPDFDVYAPLMSLPGICGTTLSNIPPPTVLSVAPELIENWRGKLAAIDGFRVGIVWQGNPQHLFDRQRSIALDQFAALASIPNVRLISLQKHAGAEQLAAARGRFHIVELGPSLDEAAGPFMDTAAVMKNLDLIIAPDTVVAHLAGALGVPVWVALRVSCDWRWLIDRHDSPWYPTMRLFRQQRRGDWTDVFERIAAALARLSSGAP